MLEGVLASLIDRIAGKYVDGIDKKATNMSVWSGHIVLKDLALKPTCLDDMDLPVKLRYGRLEQLSLDIPWKNLRAKPVIVHLSGLYMIVGPNTDASRSAQESKRLEVRPIHIIIPVTIAINIENTNHHSHHAYHHHARPRRWERSKPVRFGGGARCTRARKNTFRNRHAWFGALKRHLAIDPQARPSEAGGLQAWPPAMPISLSSP